MFDHIAAEIGALSLPVARKSGGSSTGYKILAAKGDKLREMAANH